MAEDDSTRSGSVLFVDDEPHILHSLKRLLRKEPYRLLTAAGAEEGLGVLAEEEDVRVILSDQRMPGMTGTDFLKRVRELYPHTVRVVLSGYAEASVIVDSINQGEVYRFVGKPWNDDELKATIRQCLEQYDILEENRRLVETTRAQNAMLKDLNERLEGIVDERTRSLQLAQEILEDLPVAVLCISGEGEVMLVNETARATAASLRAVIPGAPMREVLPPEAVRLVESHLAGRPDSPRVLTSWGERSLGVYAKALGASGRRRGCILVLEPA